ncbi:MULTISPECIES: hypothetical protein [Butyricimonas]|jgi:hypothetical protein|uniref:HEAT repeat domain-containing protein n=1 Tax=Butyricimonas hominis TaxID=2763032 RepID=A0ABR7D207_9BACT|nr:hypothetical protein [Butyricimonas hominis]MBC5621976.1 hypothetical protein [Butyricimonas hominis]
MENKQDILKQLADSDMEVVKSAIEQIKQEGDISIASELLDILLRSQDTTVITNITSLLSDVKDSDFKTILMDKLINATSESGKANLLRICWESAIDFSEYLDVFVDMLLNEDFITALEASTVIENLGGKIPEEKIHIAIKRLQANSDENKNFLLEDTLLHLEELLRHDDEEEDENDDHHHHDHHCGCDGH